uniref:Uncharacterized protein n=1 Tax=Oryza rufipogon TaxID=4529 RepID=A0A0E0MXN2_ORYRU
MESEDKLDLILRRMEEFKRRRVEADQRRRAEYQSLKAALESWMPEIQKNAEDLQFLVGDEQSKVTPTACSTECPNGSSPSTTARFIYDDEGTTPTVFLEHEDGEGKDHMPFIVIKDLPEFTPTMCSMICSSSDTKPDLIVPAVVTCATSVESSLEIVVTGSTTNDTHIDTPDSSKAMPANCSTVGLDVKGGTDHTKFTCQTMMVVPEGVLVPNASSKVFSPWLMVEMDLIPLLPTWCSMKCPKDKKLLMGNAKRNSWPARWLGRVIRGWKLQPVPWLGSKLYWEGIPLMPPWSPPARVSFLAWEPFDVGVLVIGIVILRHELAKLKPWPPPNQTNIRNIMVQLQRCKYRKIRVEMSLDAWKELWNLASHESCTFNGTSSLQNYISWLKQNVCGPLNRGDYKDLLDIILLIQLPIGAYCWSYLS